MEAHLQLSWTYRLMQQLKARYRYYSESAGSPQLIEASAYNRRVLQNERNPPPSYIRCALN